MGVASMHIGQWGCVLVVCERFDRVSRSVLLLFASLFVALLHQVLQQRDKLEVGVPVGKSRRALSA